MLTSTQTLFWAWLTFETIELDQIRLNLDKKNTIRFDQIQNLQFLISTAVLLPGLAAGSAISFPAVSLHFQNVLSYASSSTIHIQFIFVLFFLGVANLGWFSTGGPAPLSQAVRPWDNQDG